MFKFSQSRAGFIKIIIGFVITSQLVFLFSPGLSLAQGAAAGALGAMAGISAPGLPVKDIGLQSSEALKWNSDFTEKTILVSAMSGLLNGFSYFTRKIAYDAAVYLGSAGVGQGALIYSQGGASYFKGVGLDSVATTIDELGSPFGIKSICNPNLPLEATLKFEAQIKTGLRKLYSVSIEDQVSPEPNCKWSTIENAIDTINSGAGSIIAGVQSANKLNGYDLAAIAMANSLKIDDTDIGKVFTLMAAVEDRKNLALSGAQIQRLEGKGFKPVVDPVSGKIKTPAELVGIEAQALTSKDVVNQSSTQIAGLYGSDLWAVIPAATGLFINTFASQLMSTVLSGGLFADDGSGSSSNGSTSAEGILSEFAGVLSHNKEIAQNAFNFVLTSVPTQETSVYPLMEEFSACSDNPGLNNCVADGGLVKGVKLAASGQALTIREALDPKNNVLHPNWPLIGPSRVIDNVLDPKNGKKCYLEKYCYSNLQKLRKARILPLGFEIAALKADPEHPEDWTLKKVVDGFDDCLYDTAHPLGIASEQKPFCHLIDPNWLIRLPEPRCDAKVYTTSLISSNTNLRTYECADISTCIAEDENGKCLGAYGYCLREKNTWKIPGKSCPAQYSTCKTYVKSGTKEPVSYLSRTLVVGQCNPQSVGCRTYSVKPLANGNWVNSSQLVTPAEIKAGKNPIINFNGSIKTQTCPGNMEGCSALFRVNGNGSRGDVEYVKKAPASLFESCYLVPSSITAGEKVWPETDGEIATIKARPEAKLCAPFAPACTREETGCEAFKPADGGDTVTGIVGTNQCASTCVGYDTFKQEQPENKSAFEPAVFPMHFIPSRAEACVAADEGCSEFTNIDKAASGGESIENYSELRYCEKPNSTNQKTYYSWEGTVNQGYVLLTHTLRPISADINDRYGVISLNNIQLPAGSPAYSEYDLNILEKYLTECNQSTYEAGLVNPYGSNVAKPNCRALYDAQGQIYYRLLENTVSVSPACHPLRKSESFLKTAPNLITQPLCVAKGGKWDNTTNNCQVCYAGGLYQNGSCVYWTTGLPDEVKFCEAKAVGCQAYTGKANNNILVVLESKFEPELSAVEPLLAAKKGWSTGQIKPESVTVGQYSLEITRTKATYTFVTSTLEKGKFYELEFWARGNPQNLDIYFSDNGVRLGASPIVGRFTLNPVTDQIVKAPISSTWQAYRVGPVQFTGDANHKIDLVFESSSDQAYYLDNLRLSKISDKLFLIKNSWKENISFGGKTVLADVPAICDANPTDGLPGVALGCRAYTDSLGRAENTTGFDRLCRSEAVGCTAFTDSNNTVNNNEAVAFNLWCTGVQNTVCTISLSVQAGADPKTGEVGSCTVPAGQTGCYVKRAVLTPGLGILPDSYITQSTIIIPADTTSTLFLSLRKEFKCEDRFLGCQKIALEEQTLATSTVNAGFLFATSSQATILNNPDKYNQTLCSTSEVGCGEYKSGDTLSYFKDPSQIGNKICEYKENVSVNSTLNPTGATVVSGWFKKEVGRCSNQPKVLCKVNSDCGAGTCLDKGAVSCYDNYFSNGEYGIWSNKSAEYKDFVGVCPAEYSQCTELRDPTDTSDSANNSGSTVGKSYFVIYDAVTRRTASACEGKAGLKDGCVLFDQTENPTKIYDSIATKTASEIAKPKYSLVTPVSSSKNDTNVLLKVEQNRQCSEWLSCKNMVTAVVGGKEQKVCYEYKSCRKVNDILECGKWSSKSEQVSNPLNEQVYTGRDTSWYGQDYSGYSLFNKFPISGLTYINVTSTGNGNLPQQYAGFEMGRSNLLIDADKFSCDKKSNYESCGTDLGGRCFDKKCVYPLDGSFKGDVGNTEIKITQDLIGTSCKMYPEQDSPFPQSIAARTEGIVSLGPTIASEKTTRYNFTRPASGYEGVGQNVCQSSGDCSCEYQKVTYKSGVVDYWSLSQNNIPSGVCSGGDKDGRACGADADCSNGFVNGVSTGGGVCSVQSKYESVTGLRGICLEDDYSRPISVTGQQNASFACLTWLPISAGLSSFDSYNYKEEAGYSPSIDAKVGALQGGEVYCRNATANGQGAVNSDYFKRIVDISGDCSTNQNDIFACNQKIYKKLFNKYGDYIGDNRVISGLVKVGNDVKAYDAFNPEAPLPFRTLITRMNDPFNNLWYRGENNHMQVASSLTATNDLGSNSTQQGFPLVFGSTDWLKGTGIFDNQNLINFTGDHDYENKIYSLMQMWAWHGGMYGKGVYSQHTQPIGIFHDPILTFTEKDCSIYTGIFWAECIKFNDSLSSEAGKARFNLMSTINGALPDIDDDSNLVTPEITNPGATVLFTSSLYFRDYLFSSLRFVDVGKNDINKIRAGYERRPLHEGTNLEAGSNTTHRTFDFESNSDYLSYGNITGNIIDGASSDQGPYIKSNNRISKGKNSLAYDPVFSNYEANYKLYDDEISALHFGPLMIPSSYMANGVDSSRYFPTMVNFDFDALRSAKFQNLKSGKNSYPYELQNINNADNNLYYFRIKKNNNAGLRYLAVAMSDKPEDTDLVGFFKPIIDAAVENGGTMGKMGDWQMADKADRSLLWIWVDFDSSGRMISNFKNSYDAWYRDTGIDQIYEDQKFRVHNGITPFLAVVAELHPRCAEFGIVHNNQASFGDRKDKAWTDRLWQYTGQALPPNGDVTGVGRVNRSTAFPLYGSTWLSKSSFEGAEEIPDTVPKISLDWSNARRKYVFADILSSGVMYNCTAPAFEPNSGGTFSQKLLANDPSWKINNNLFSTTGCSSVPNPEWNTVGKIDVYDYVPRNPSNDVTTDRLTRLFAAYYQVVKNTDNNRNWEKQPTWQIDLSGTIVPLTTEKLLPPQVYSLNPATCYSSTANKTTCLAGEANNVTINRRNGTNTDYNGDGLADENGAAVIGQDGALPVTMQFFGFADHNRMPLARVMVDWGDGSIMNENTTGRYQNHKPFCIAVGEENNPQIKECAKSTYLTCREDKDCPKVGGQVDKCSVSAKRFGNSARACYSRYFEFFHGYDCSQDLIDLAVKNSSVANYVVSFGSLSPSEQSQLAAAGGYTAANTPRVCVFVPKVQLLDNWGWCTGSCDGGKGCYEKKLIGGVPIDQCDAKTPAPWIRYEGRIVVVPK